MSRYKVADVTTANVISVREDTPFREIVELLETHHISAVPVVNWTDVVVGVISEADLMSKMEQDERGGPRLFEGHRLRALRDKASGALAQELMTAPAIVTMPEESVGLAARKMELAGVKRLPVVNLAGRLVGIVSRRDLLRTFLRSDVAITGDVRAELSRIAGVDADGLAVATTDGQVTLSGTLDRRSLVATVLDRVAVVDGVVGVVSRLAYRTDDTTFVPFAMP